MLPPDRNMINDQPTTPYRQGPSSHPNGSYPQVDQELPTSRPGPTSNATYQEGPPHGWQGYSAPTPVPTSMDRSSAPPPVSVPVNRPSAPSRGPRTGAILLLATVLLVVFGTGAFSGWVYSQNSMLQDPSRSQQNSQNNVPAATVPPLSGNNIESVRAAVVAKVRPAVVQINATLRQGTAVGSGVIIDERGYIITNNHVVEGAREIEVVLSDGTKLPAELTGTDPADDLAVIKIEPPDNMAVASLGDSTKLQVGQEVLAIGNPLGITQTVTNGIISALGRNVDAGEGVTIMNAIQTDAPINPGNSGGALVDLQGNVIGIPTLTALNTEFNTPANGVGFAIPSNRVQQIAPQIIEHGKVEHTGRAVLGIRAADVDPAMQQRENLATDHGVLIAEITAGGPAEKAGLKEGDIIVGIDNKNVNNMAGLQDVLGTKKPGDKVSLSIFRGNQQTTVNVTLGEAEAE